MMTSVGGRSATPLRVVLLPLSSRVPPPHHSWIIPRVITEKCDADEPMPDSDGSAMGRLLHNLNELLRNARMAKPSDLEGAQGLGDKSRIHAYLAFQKFLALESASERFLRAFPGPHALDLSPMRMLVSYPPSSLPNSREDAEMLLRQTAIYGRRYHRTWLGANGLLLPASALATVLPGPNLFFLINAYRAYANWTAMQGARTLLSLIDNRAIDYDPSPELEKLYGGAAFFRNDNLFVDDQVLVKIEERLDLPEFSRQAKRQMQSLSKDT